MPEDVKAALERFQTFLDRWGGGAIIDEASGFTAADGYLIASEIQMLEVHHSAPDENPID